MKTIVVNEDKLLHLLQDMIRIESVNPSLVSDGHGESRIANHIRGCLEKMGLEVKSQEVDRDRVNVIGVLKSTGKGKSIMLNGHTDTVSINDMDIEPLNPRFENDKVYGRGALDMKSGLAAMIMTVKSIIESGIKLRGDVLLAFVADEEYRSLGTEKLLEEYAADAAIVCEPTDLKITIAHKGFAWVKVEVFGKRAHGSLPGKGIDAIAKTGKVLVEIEKLGKKLLCKKQHPLLDSPSVHASLINGGVELSTYPDYCKIELERRTLPDENRETFVQELREIIKKIQSEDGEFNADFDVFFYRPALEVPRDQPIVQSLSRATKSVLGKEPEYAGVSWWLDAALLAEAGIPTAIFGPSGEGLHASVEYVDFGSVVATTNVLIHTIIDFCGA